MKTVTNARLGIGLFVGSVVCALGTVPGLLATWEVENEGAWGFRGYGIVTALVFAGAGGLLTTRRPENAVGWLFGAVGWALAIITAGEVYGATLLIQGRQGGIIYQIAWVSSWSWIVFVGLIAFAILLFPTGTLPSERWRVPARLMVGATVLGCIGFAFAPGPMSNLPERFTNRYALPPGPFADFLVYGGMLGFMATMVVAAGAVVHRFRKSEGVQRQQMKLFALAATGLALALVVVVIAQVALPALAEPAEIFSTIATMAVPVAMAVAILRYRLFDLDVVVNRTLVYGSLTAILVGSYFAIVVVLRSLLGPVTGDSDLAVAGSTLAVAALFRPVRSRVQSFIDRRFYRQKYDSAETLGHFSVRLREQVDLESVTRDLLEVVGTTVQPAHASVWLRV